MVGDITIVRCSAKAVETTTMQNSWNKQENKINYTGKEKNAIFFNNDISSTSVLGCALTLSVAIILLLCWL